jgi:hypothetical protein
MKKLLTVGNFRHYWWKKPTAVFRWVTSKILKETVFRLPTGPRGAALKHINSWCNFCAHCANVE